MPWPHMCSLSMSTSRKSLCPTAETLRLFQAQTIRTEYEHFLMAHVFSFSTQIMLLRSNSGYLPTRGTSEVSPYPNPPPLYLETVS